MYGHRWRSWMPKRYGRRPIGAARARIAGMRANATTDNGSVGTWFVWLGGPPSSRPCAPLALGRNFHRLTALIRCGSDVSPGRKTGIAPHQSRSRVREWPQLDQERADVAVDAP